jgi:hypothetical protein
LRLYRLPWHYFLYIPVQQCIERMLRLLIGEMYPSII